MNTVSVSLNVMSISVNVLDLSPNTVMVSANIVRVQQFPSKMPFLKMVLKFLLTTAFMDWLRVMRRDI